VICIRQRLTHLPPESWQRPFGRSSCSTCRAIRSEWKSSHSPEEAVAQTQRSRLAALARASEGFSGAEIDRSHHLVVVRRFSGQVELSTELVLKNLTETVPLSKTMNEERAG